MASISSWLRTFSMIFAPRSFFSILILSVSNPSSARAAGGGAHPPASGAHHFRQPRAQPHYRERMNLRHARLADAQHRSYFLHGELLEVIERQNVLFLVRQLANDAGQQVFHLRTQAAEKRCVLGRIGQVVAQIFFLAVPGRLDAQAADFEAVELAQQVLQLLQGHPEFGRDFVFRGGAAQLQAELAVGFFDLARLAPQLARTPVHFAQTVEDGAADAELGVGTELHLLGTVKLVERVDQSEHAGMHQVLERHVAGQPFVDAACQVFDLGQLFEQDAVAFFFFVLILILPGGVGLRGVLAHGILTSREKSTLSSSQLSATLRPTAPRPPAALPAATARPAWAETAPAAV